MLVHFLIEKPNEQAVAIFSEDTRQQIEERLDFIVRGLDITTKEVFDRTFFKTLDNDDGRVFAFMDAGVPTLDEKYYSGFINGMIDRDIGFVIFDPLERFHNGLMEKDEGHMKFLVTTVFQKIGVLTGAAIVVLHHTAKGDKGGSRGSTVITNKGRVAYNVRKNKIIDKESGIEKVRQGWESSVLLSTIKDNHYVARWCDILSNKDGKLDLPVAKRIDHLVIEYEEKMEMPYVE
jgi:RecA-family ATPase